jgi:hypothetical protein
MTAWSSLFYLATKILTYARSFTLGTRATAERVRSVRKLADVMHWIRVIAHSANATPVDSLSSTE